MSDDFIENLLRGPDEEHVSARLDALIAEDHIKQSVWPCVIVPARYGGTYEGAPWLAFHCYINHVPNDAFSDDTTCAAFWRMYRDESITFSVPRWRGVPNDMMTLHIGFGNTPNEAYADLYNKVKDEK